MTAAAPAAASAAVDRLAAALGPVERRETHGSWVLLTADRAYKVKKPLVLDFLDYGTLERRRAMCREEVEQNRRGAPDVYLGVRAIVPTATATATATAASTGTGEGEGEREGVALAPEDAPGAIEYAVEMRRFDEHATLAAAGDGTGVIERVGRALAAYHDRCPVVEAPGAVEQLRRTVDDNFATLATLLAGRAADARRLALAQRFAVAFLAARAAQLEARAAAGRVLDGHGDLRAEHVVLGPRIELVDAIEFDPALRRTDAGLDLAFLVMDLHALGRAGDAAGLVRAYRDAGGDPGDDELVAFFASYRAQVRAKVALIRAGQPGADAAAARTEAGSLLRLAGRLAWRALGPIVLAVCGPAASGKTTLAAALSVRSGLPHYSSDVVRKRRRGLAPSDRAPAGAYTAAANADTYRALGALAAGSPSGAIVDATFRRATERHEFREALGEAADRLVFVECRVPLAILRERAGVRLRDPRRVSDATPALAARQLEEFEPLDEVPAGAHLLVRADRDPYGLAAEVADRLGARPAP